MKIYSPIPLLFFITLTILPTKQVLIIKNTDIQNSNYKHSPRNLQKISEEMEKKFRIKISEYIITALKSYYPTLTNTDNLKILVKDPENAENFVEGKTEFVLNDTKILTITIDDHLKDSEPAREVVFNFLSELNMTVEQQISFQYMEISEAAKDEPKKEEDKEELHEYLNDVQEMVNKYIWRFCEKIIQIDFKVKDLKEDVMNMFKVDFSVEGTLGATASIPVIIKTEPEIPMSSHPNFNKSVIDYDEKEKKVNDIIRFVIEEKGNDNEFSERISNVTNSQSKENTLFFLIHPTDSRFDHIELYIVYIPYSPPTNPEEEDEIMKNKNKIHIIIESAYFQYDYEFNILTKRFIIKTIERLFLRIRDQIYPSLINVAVESNPKNLTYNLARYLNYYNDYFATKNEIKPEDKEFTISNASIYNSECEYEIKLSQNENNFTVEFESASHNQDLDLRKIKIKKIFPISSMYYTEIFPKGFLTNIIKTFQQILPNINTEGKLVPNTGAYKDMVNPFVDGIEKISQYSSVLINVDQIFNKIQINKFKLNVFEYGKNHVKRVDYVAYEVNDDDKKMVLI